MSALSAQWAQWAAKFAALTRRERAVTAAAILLGGSFLIFRLVIDPFLFQAHSASRLEATARAELTQQQALAVGLKAKSADPDAANRRRLAQAKKDTEAIGQRLASFESGMVPPAKMQAFLEALLAKNRTIELLGLKTLPATRVGVSAVVEKTEATEGIYQHGIEIRLAGSYNDLLNYLAELERMPQRMMWNSVSLTVEKHPRNVMVLRVYTLSLDRNWLVV